jgi:hypothetical protein
MQYMMILNESPEAFASRQDAEKSGPYWGAWGAFIGAMRAAGIIVNGDGLHGPETATTLRIRDGKNEVQDGPFADTKESVGGYFVIEVPDLDAALEWAARSPAATDGSVEIRPVMMAPAAAA